MGEKVFDEYGIPGIPGRAGSTEKDEWGVSRDCESDFAGWYVLRFYDLASNAHKLTGNSRFLPYALRPPAISACGFARTAGSEVRAEGCMNGYERLDFFSV